MITRKWLHVLKTAMSNIIIYLPNEPLGKQGGMEKATHQLACLLRDSGHNVSLLCQQKTG